MKTIYIAAGREVTGPFADEEIKQGLKEGKWHASTLAWRSGLKAWAPLHRVEMDRTIVGEVFAAKPPPLPDLLPTKGNATWWAYLLAGVMVFGGLWYVLQGKPEIFITPDRLEGLTTKEGQTSKSQSYEIHGKNLKDNIRVRPSTGFEVSLNQESGFKEGLTLNLDVTQRTLSKKTVYVRISERAGKGPLVGSISHSGGGFSEARVVSISGFVEDVVISQTGRRIGEWIPFNQNESTIREDARSQIVQILSLLRSDEFKKFRSVQLIGYTSSEGEISRNNRLDELRAESVKKEFITLGIPESAITTLGGDQANRAGSKDPDPKFNRRVDVYIMQ
jgi:outer membrane protein OmpA-like peptidoglycan-associated protein